MMKDWSSHVKIDRDKKKRPGFKFAQYEMEGVPIRVGIGMRDLEKNQVEIARRDTKEKSSVPLEGLDRYISDLLVTIQDSLLQKAKDYRTEHTSETTDFEEFKSILENKGGFIKAHWDGTTETELKIKELTKASIRCIPNDEEPSDGKCILTGKESKQKVLFAKAY